MRYYIGSQGNYIAFVGIGLGHKEITKEKYDSIIELANHKPIPSGGYDYCLRADTLEWELVELPPIFSNDNEDERI